MNSFIVPFSLTADQVNALDTTPVDLGSFGPAVASLVRVPVRAEVWRDAGTVYTVTPVSGSIRSDTVTEFDNMFSEIKPISPAMELVVRRKDSRGEYGEAIFHIPTAILENPLKSGMVIFPDPGATHIGGDFSLTIEALTTLSGGTGSVHGRLYFEEYSLPL